MKPIVSIIIPCFNSGKYLPDALDSIESYPDKSVYDVIIVNDGSTDNDTLSLLDTLDQSDYTIIHQENKGPGAARNTGVKAAKGEYLLFLDSDNKIRANYIEKGIQILNTHKEVDIVHGKPYFFGEVQNKPFKAKKFNLSEIIKSNYIDMCSVIRKRVWEDLGGFDENRILIGHEDWEFWIRAGAANFKFYYVDEVLFDYRIRNDSLTQSKEQQAKLEEMLRYVYGKHLLFFIRSYKDLYHQFLFYKNDQEKPFRTFIKYMYYKYFSNRRKYSLD